jgi:hypothetical protein
MHMMHMSHHYTMPPFQVGGMLMVAPIVPPQQFILPPRPEPSHMTKVNDSKLVEQQHQFSFVANGGSNGSSMENDLNVSFESARNEQQLQPASSHSWAGLFRGGLQQQYNQGISGSLDQLPDGNAGESTSSSMESSMVMLGEPQTAYSTAHSTLERSSSKSTTTDESSVAVGLSVATRQLRKKSLKGNSQVAEMLALIFG